MADDSILLLPNLTRRVVDAAEVIGQAAPDRPEFLHAVLCQVGLPRSRQEGRTFVRSSGRISLMIEAGMMATAPNEWAQAPLPYGTKPRLALYHLCSEAVRLRSPRVEIGRSLGDFLGRLGIERGGTTYKQFRQQMQALAVCTMSLSYMEEGRLKQSSSRPVRKFDAWWPSDPRQSALWDSEIILSDEFYATLVGHAVPLDPRAIHALQHSALALDAYTWLAHRLCRVTDPKGVRLDWQNLREQFGQEYTSTKDFKREFRSALLKARAVYPDAHIDAVAGGIVLHQSPPPIAKTQVVVALSKGVRRA